MKKLNAGFAGGDGRAIKQRETFEGADDGHTQGLVRAIPLAPLYTALSFVCCIWNAFASRSMKEIPFTRLRLMDFVCLPFRHKRQEFLGIYPRSGALREAVLSLGKRPDLGAKDIFRKA